MRHVRECGIGSGLPTATGGLPNCLTPGRAQALTDDGTGADRSNDGASRQHSVYLTGEEHSDPRGFFTTLHDRVTLIELRHTHRQAVAAT